jgi:RHS repeat-associated protein
VIGSLTYTYDANGQRIAVGGSLASSGFPKQFGLAQYDANNRLTKLDGVSYTYDNNGNLLNDGVNTYIWNARDQLVAVSGANTATYTYDGLGRRRKGVAYSTLYDGWNPIQLKSGATVVENRLTGLGLDAYYARVRDGAVQSYLTNALGSTLQLRDGAQNAVAGYVYDPYGGTAGTVNPNVTKYTGREQDFADLYYYRNRYYKPSIGRFISEDPIGLAGGINAYGYVQNDPINRFDPSGLADINLYLPFLDGALYGFAEAWNPSNAIVVAGHGSAGAFGNRFGQIYTPKELALKIKSLKRYKANIPVVLTGCYTGDPNAVVPGPDVGNGIQGFLPVYAQQLANELGATVLAPSGSFHVESKNGGYNASIINGDGSPGRFVPYRPQVPVAPPSSTPSWGSYNSGPGGPFYAVGGAP